MACDVFKVYLLLLRFHIVLSLHGRLTIECFLSSLYRNIDEESYSVEFVFDADVSCSVTVHYRATEDFSTGLAM